MTDLAQARKYITELHRKQNDPYCWPDYLTGLPGQNAIIRKLEKLYPRLGTYSIAYARISNIYPYLIKYGYKHHADIIEWSAAIFKTAFDNVKDSFVGAIDTHGYVIMAKSRDLDPVLSECARLFGKKTGAYYSPEDRKKGSVLSFHAEGKCVSVGLMGIIYCAMKEKTAIPRRDLIQHLAAMCAKLESESLQS
ncbi:MAG: hypothetical protein M0Z52_07555 [Actinomycetota bacterium]|nr:hypothetical protein [Actinomycetota bacterium]